MAGCCYPPSLFTSCEGYFGVEPLLTFLDEPTYENQQVAYVPIQPVWEGLGYPIDIIAGYDELIYVADSLTSEIISYDQAGNELGRFQVPGLRGIAQDRRLNLYATGTKDTLMGGINFTHLQHYTRSISTYKGLMVLMKQALTQ